MTIVSASELEYLKGITSLWKNTEDDYVPQDDRVHAGFAYGADFILPKLFCKKNRSELLMDQYGSAILQRSDEADRYWTENSEVYPTKKLVVEFEPRPEQEPLFKSIKDKMDTDGNIGGIIKAPPGFGKSYCSIKLAGIYKQQTLIVVPNDILSEQFKEGIQQFSNLEEDDIGMIQGSDVLKLMKNGQYNKDICIVKIQSLLAQMKSIDALWLKGIYSRFGLVFYDECHVSGSALGYSKTASIMATDNIIGLSATPFTKGINNFLMTNSMGEILIDVDHQNLIPDVTLYNVPAMFDGNEQNQLRYAAKDYIMFLAKHNSMLENKLEYLNYIAEWAIYNQSIGHTVAVLFANNKLVTKVYDIIKSKGYDVGMIVGKTKKVLPKQVHYLDRMNYQLYLQTYKEVFPKRKSIKEYKEMIKEKQLGYHLTKPFEKDIEKINEYLLKIGREPIHIEKSTIITKTEREIMNEKPIIVSNFKLLSAGYDKSSLSNILIGTPLIGKVPVIQVTGRITRTHKEKIQEVQAQFFFTDEYIKTFSSMPHVLVNNLKVAYPTASYKYEGFTF